MNIFKKLFNKKSSDYNIKKNSESLESKSYDEKNSIQVDRNLNSIEKEQKREIEVAIKEYEQNIDEGFEGNHPYDRLAIIYRKNKDYDNEIRVLNRGIEIFNRLSKSSPRQDIKPKLEKFKKRLEKAEELKNTR